MIQERAVGYIKDIDENGTAAIVAVLPSLKHALDRKYNEVEIILPDARRITPSQRRKIYCLIGEIAEHVNGQKNAAAVEETKNIMKWDFALKMMESQERKLFSLANVDETTASAFVTYLIDFIVENGVPMSVPLIEQCEDIAHYMYTCVMAKKCCICGREAELHHVDTVGMGNDRDEIDHLGKRCLSLCRKHHQEYHDCGYTEFIQKYHLEPVTIDKAIAKKYKLGKRREKNV